MIKPLVQDNIVALATPTGVGAIAIVRISGQELINIYKQITGSKTNPIPRYANYKTIIDSNKNPIDNCLITYFKGPSSFTGEDILEISCHGGEFIPKAILSMLYALKVRQASPGEFSYRAFINGKIDLVQAESISGIISAKTSKNAQVQLSNLNGKLSNSILEIRNKTINLLTILEHELDFSEEEISFTKVEDINKIIKTINDPIEEILKSFNFGSIINTGIRVVLCGKPNAGKSSLFNKLSGSNRAIVTDIAGTTRDTIETWLEISGIPVCIIDTAGINNSSDKIEAIGVKKSNSEISNSDILLVLDEEDPLHFFEYHKLYSYKKYTILIHTKSDLKSSSVKSENVINISVKNNSGIDQLYTELSTLLKKNINYEFALDPVIMSNRQNKLLNSGHHILGDIKTLLLTPETLDIIILSSLLREFSEVLEELLGKISNDDIFDNLFSSFCIGK